MFHWSTENMAKQYIWEVNCESRKVYQGQIRKMLAVHAKEFRFYLYGNKWTYQEWFTEFTIDHGVNKNKTEDNHLVLIIQRDQKPEIPK